VLLTVTSTAPQADDLGHLLHKHPARVQSFDLSVGTAHVFYPRADAQVCTAALLLEVDPVGLVRGAASAAQYVDERPYAASSLLAVAIGRVFGSALKGRCDARPELVDQPLPLELHLPAVPGDPQLLHRLFGPLGWQVAAHAPLRDPQVPDWGDSPFVDLRLSGHQVLADALSHLYVLLPVLADDKHYWVGTDEVDKLLRAGGRWLAGHPERELITARALAHQRTLVGDATARLLALDGAEVAVQLVSADVGTDPSAEPTAELSASAGPSTAEAPSTARAPSTAVPLAVRRRSAILGVLHEVGAHRVVDLGCGEGRLLADLLADPAFSQVVGADVSTRALDRAERRLNLDRMPDSVRARLTLRQSSVTYADDELVGFDAIVLSEVVEHLDLDRLPALEATVLGHAAPQVVVLTTPNAEHNLRYPDLAHGGFRHADHRFEWSRSELADWAEAAAARYGYTVQLRGVGEDDPAVGPPTQLALFRRAAPVAVVEGVA
jgi:3' terminal RNA ribose 2'-O-methyltransferase Hen1